MAFPPQTYRQDRVNRAFAAALLLSLGLHIAVLAALPKPADEVKPPLELVVELQPPPAPPEPPPPEPPKPPEPKPVPKKPIPKPKPEPKPEPLPEPPRMDEPPTEPPPPPPPVISAPPEPTVVPEVVVPPPPPEPPPKPKVPPEPDLNAARNQYSSQLSREFAKYKQYPRIAQMRGWQGVVKVELKIDGSGAIQSLTIATSSGFEVLDKQALEMVRKATPLPQPPETLRGREFNIIVPVAFRLE